MTLSSLVRTLRLLHAYLMRPHGARRDVQESRFVPEGSKFPTIVYRPLRPPHRTLVLVHGVTGRAAEDPSLVHLARCLAGLGYTCVTPSLGHLAEFRHVPADIDAIVEGVRFAVNDAQARVGVLGFSYGSSLALSAAADRRVRDDLHALVGFGAYFELPDVLEHQRQLLLAHPNPAQDDADLAYLRYTLLACQRDWVDLSSEAWEAIDPLLRRFTSRAPIEQKRAPLLKYAAHIDYARLMEHYQASELPRELSPSTVLGAIACPVGFCHDPGDRFVPASQVDKLREALDQRVGVQKTLVLTTRMLSHVQVDPRKNLSDLPRLVELLDLVLQ